jgi:hypothetical protein
MDLSRPLPGVGATRNSAGFVVDRRWYPLHRALGEVTGMEFTEGKEPK